LLQDSRCFRPNRAGSFFSTFSTKEHATRGGQPQIGDLQSDDLAHARTRVEHQTQERDISAAVGCIRLYRFYDRLNLVKIQMLDLATDSAFERDTENALRLLQVFGMLST
jgi:hypothetical protein